MSRVSKNPVSIPSGVDVSFKEAVLTVKGKLGQLTQAIHQLVECGHDNSELTFAPRDASNEAKALAGTMRALVNNMVHGVSEGFVRELELVGVGYRAKAQGKVINIAAGFSHPVDYPLPEGVTAETPSNTEIVLKGANKQQVSQVAAEIRSIRPPEPYKGKGIRYKGEHIIRKEGKKK